MKYSLESKISGFLGFGESKVNKTKRNRASKEWFFFFFFLKDFMSRSIQLKIKINCKIVEGVKLRWPILKRSKKKKKKLWVIGVISLTN